MRCDLAIEVVRITEAAALAAAGLIGRGDERAADEAAVAAVHDGLRGLPIDAVVRIGEGSADEANRLYVGERLGTGFGGNAEIAAVPLEGSSAVARGDPNALSVLAIAEDGGFLPVPDVYMDKIAVGPGLPEGIVDLDEEPRRNLAELAKAKAVAIGDLVACILDRPRHRELIAKTRAAGARIMLIADGDVSGVIATATPRAGVDIFMGVGGAPHGVLAAAALACLGGQMQARLVFRNDSERRRAAALRIDDLDRKLQVADMVRGSIIFAATASTTGTVLEGVSHVEGIAVTHSLLLRSAIRESRFIETFHGVGRPSGGRA
jgi:fructose-1,6-bisphosphatase II / sedoheptulose-1,7-bisphosphatase